MPGAIIARLHTFGKNQVQLGKGDSIRTGRIAGFSPLRACDSCMGAVERDLFAGLSGEIGGSA
jgi:hypothetical protein